MNNDFNLTYLIADVECLSDYFSLQCKNELSDNIYVYECYNDEDIHRLYNLLEQSTRPQYYYSIDYDKVILNALCKLVEKGHTNIIPKLRQINDYIIQKKINYFQLNRSFWCDYYFKYKENEPELKHEELFSRSKSQFSGNEYDFISEFPDVLGQSNVIKNTIMNSIPKIMYYFSIRKDNSIIPTISLKNLQLINEGYNVKFDFNKYTSIEQIKFEGLYDDFIKYSRNDISSLEKIFLGKPKEDIIKRFYAVEAVKTINPDFEATNRMLYSENNTELICSVLKLDDLAVNKDVDIDYTEHIKTNYEKFNNFVSFVNDQKEVKKDSDIKNSYQSYYEIENDNDDYNILDSGNASTQTNSFDVINIKNQLNDIDVKIGFGGAHGAIPEYIGENLLHYDYDGQYPSVILQYKEYFKHVINIELYEAIYKLRIDSKPKIEELEAEIKEIQNRIIAGATLLDIKLELLEEELEKIKNIVSGLKLILNSSFGLINSNFNIPISCKKLGRFICLKGQSLILNLIDELKENHKISNVNTDGVICTKNTSKLIEIDRDGYFNVSIKTIDKLVQNDVNNYIGFSSNKIKKKGMFNLSIKQWINKNEKLAPNLFNAINLMSNKKIEVRPVYFDRRYFTKEILDKQWYFTDIKRGQQIIKNLKKPEIISFDNKIIYFTDKKEDAEFGLYEEYAKTTLNKIYDFNYHKSVNKNLSYFEETLDQDTEKNIKEKRTKKRELGKIFGSKQLGFVGYQSKNKRVSYINNEPVKPLIQYTMTDILKSTYCTGFLVENNRHNLDNPFVIIDIDIFNKNTGGAKKGWQIIKPLLSVLKDSDTFSCWNNKTEKYNKKYIFLNPDKTEIKLNERYSKYVELLNRATVYTIDGLGDINYDCNWSEIKNIPLDLLETLK